MVLTTVFTCCAISYNTRVLSTRPGLEGKSRRKHVQIFLVNHADFNGTAKTLLISSHRCNYVAMKKTFTHSESESLIVKIKKKKSS